MTRRPPTSGEIREAAEAVSVLASRPAPPILTRSLRDLHEAAASLRGALHPGWLAGLLSPVRGDAEDAMRATALALDTAERALREEADRQRGTAAALDLAGRRGAAAPAGIGAAAARARAAAYDGILAAAVAWREASGGNAQDLLMVTERLCSAAEALARSLEHDPVSEG